MDQKTQTVLLYIQNLYKNCIQNITYSKNQQADFQAQLVSITYGELLALSAVKLINKLKLTKDDKFLDLGSGLGKLAMQVFMLTDVKSVLGIEASNNLSMQAQKVLGQASIENPGVFHGDFELLAANFLNSDWEDPTVVYTCSTAFSQELILKIGEKINQTPSIQKVATLRPIPNLKNFKLVTQFLVECSWDSSLVYYYCA